MPQAFYSNPKSDSFKNLKIGVLAGGVSSERKVSLRSGKAVLHALKRAGFAAALIDSRDPKKLGAALKKIHIVFIALHGQGGEDGTIQAVLERRKIPYIGS